MRPDPHEQDSAISALPDLDPESGRHLHSALLDALGDAVIATDLSGRIFYWNEAATRIYGWQPDEVLGSSILDVTPAEGMKQYASAIMEALRRGETWSGEFLIRHRDGHIFPVMVTDTGVRDTDGSLIGVVGVSRPIAVDAAVGHALQESEERLDLVRRAAPSVIWELDPATDTVRWSEALQDIFGYDADAIEPTMDWRRERIHPDDRVRLDRSVADFLAQDRRFWTEEYRFRRADGTYAEVFDRAHAARRASGEPTRVVGAMVDLSERRRLQDEHRLISQAGMILDLSMDYESTLPTLARLAVNAVADFVILHIEPGHRLPPLTVSAHADPVRQVHIEEAADFLAAGLPSSPLTNRVLQDGESVLLRSVPEELLHHPDVPEPLHHAFRRLEPGSGMLLPLRARAEVFGFMVLGRSAASPAFDDAQLSVGEELARRISQAVDNARLYQSAQLANQAKADFLSIISHELRTPLMAVLGYADLLDQEVSGSLNDPQKRQVARIRAGSDRLHRLIESILAYVRLETGQETPQLMGTSIPEILDRVREIVAPRARDQGVEFRVASPPAGERLVTDPDHTVQILLALLTNALKFTDDGTVELRVARDDVYLNFDVVDTGPGIPAEHQPYIFNAFWQVEQPSTRRAGGAGLGLSVARRLARLMGGDVVLVESTPRGTTLRFRLPLGSTS